MTIRLLSGVEAEIQKMSGKHQRYFTQRQYQEGGKGFNMVLQECVTRLGSKNGITEDEAAALLREDRKQLLLALREHSMRRHPKFEFEYQFLDQAGKKKTHPVSLDFKMDDLDQHPYPEQFEEYEDIWKGQYEGGYQGCVYLEDLDRHVYYRWPTGKDEAKVETVPESQRSLHTLLVMRDPVTFEETDNGVTPVNLNLDKLSYDDIEDLHEHVMNSEGRQDSTMIVRNPETGEDEGVDLLTIPAFFSRGLQQGL